ncbi:MAG: glycosyltransferase family A protein [Caldilineaceae bacterium]
MTKRAKIHAVIVNHNTSAYVELALRSLHKRHADDLDLAITIVDNASTDDTSSLLAYADDRGIPVRQSGFTTDTASNSHGEVLRQFVLDHPDCDDYLFLDADICFLEDDTIHAMLAELTTAEDAFAVGVRQTWDGQDEIPADIHQAIYYNRLHPCCALVRNTPLFRQVTDEIGFTGVKYCWVDGEKYLDTFELMTRVMKTHGLRHLISPKMVYHFFSVSYDDRWMESKNQRRDALLASLR